MNSETAKETGQNRGILFGLSGGMLWALDSVILSIALAPFEMIWFAPVCATFIHDSVSALILIIQSILRGRLKALLQVFKNRESLWLVLAGILGGPVGMCGYVFCISFLGPGLSAVLSCLYPAFGLILSFLFFHQRFSGFQILGLLLSMAGVAALSMGSGLSAGSSFIPGLLCGLVCALGWSLEGLAAQKGTENGKISSKQALSIRQCVSSLSFGLILVPLVSGWPLVTEIFHSSSFWIIAAAACAGTASYLCYYKAISLISAARAMPLNITYSAWAIVFSALISRIWPSLTEILAAAAVLGGALMCSSQKGDGKKDQT